MHQNIERFCKQVLDTKKQIQGLQEHIDKERSKQSSKFKSFLNSFLADILLFVAAC